LKLEEGPFDRLRVLSPVLTPEALFLFGKSKKRVYSEQSEELFDIGIQGLNK
jgi:hypothetical protein